MSKTIRSAILLCLLVLVSPIPSLDANAQQAPGQGSTSELGNAPRMIDAFRVDTSSGAPKSTNRDRNISSGLGVMAIFGTTLVVGALVVEARRRRIHERRRRRY